MYEKDALTHVYSYSSAHDGKVPRRQPAAQGGQNYPYSEAALISDVMLSGFSKEQAGKTPARYYPQNPV